MSKQMRLLVTVLGVVVLAAVVLTMFGKPPNLPLGPLQGMLAKDDTVDATATGADATGLGTPVNPCPPGQVLASTLGGAGTAGATGAAGTPGAATDPAAGVPATSDPAAGTAPPATSDGSATVGAAADGWSGDTRVVAAGAVIDGRVVDEPIYAADAMAPTDPAAAGAAGGAGGAATDPAATRGAAGGAVTDPAAAGAAAATPNCVPDPAAAAAGAGGAAGVPGATATPGAAGTPGATGAAPAAGGISKATSDGSNSGNSPEALRIAADVTKVMQQAQITVQTTATLSPAAGGVGGAPALRRYRATVTSAVLVIKLTDPAALQQWTSAGKKVQATLVTSFLQRLGKNYKRSSRSISVVDSAGTLLAVGDAIGRGPVRTKLY